MQGSVFGWLLIGMIAGVVGKLLMPGRDPGGFIVTILLGIAGALLAGLVAIVTGFELGDGIGEYVAAAIGAFVLLGVYRLIVRANAGN